jgi:hypothetical protein
MSKRQKKTEKYCINPIRVTDEGRKRSKKNHRKREHKISL